MKASIICEGSNGPVTPGADAILEDKGVLILPDVLANAGGVIVSYFEWVQGLQEYFWKESEVNAKLNDIMSRAFDETWETAERASCRCGLRRTGSACNASPRPRSRVASIRSPQVVVYHADGCHLCERALEQVRALQDELGFDLLEVDITGDEALEKAHREWLPVVEIDGNGAFTYHVQVDSFRRAVAQATAES